MAYASACTVVTRAKWPRRHDTLLWGDLEVYTPAVLVVVALTALNFYVCVDPGEPRVLAALLGPFACVVSFPVWKPTTGSDRTDKPRNSSRSLKARSFRLVP